MNKWNTERLVCRWPKWFDVKGNIQHTLMPFGFECGDGWFDLIWLLCEDIEKIGVPGGFEVIQVKEKFGGLRFYVVNDTNAISERIGQAEVESEQTCEECGKPGKIVERRGWLRAACEEHSID